jgi:hypothetical protein
LYRVGAKTAANVQNKCNALSRTINNIKEIVNTTLRTLVFALMEIIGFKIDFCA